MRGDGLDQCQGVEERLLQQHDRMLDDVVDVQSRHAVYKRVDQE